MKRIDCALPRYRTPWTKPHARSVQPASELRTALLLTLIVTPISVHANDGASRSRKLAFNRDIRPILADKCFKCHGPDAKQRKAKLRLDDATRHQGSGRVGKRGDRAGQGRRERAVSPDHRRGPDERMPPADSGKSLSAAEIALLKTMDRGRAPLTKDTGRSLPPVRPALPAVKNRAGAATRSTSSSWPSSKRRGWRLRPRPIGPRCSGG